ncbi:L-serine ammonia-lyase, iron-sulfur-dependent, subunit alpha [Entomospira entomophila]|uniref:L-serine ammonia-lyase n=1 Tax=Entomospira entomophila TaxID=2719988 RepID=A0A968KTN8_9SPIO|nr:L-serine ammonia-lyase, iron-sulfur-dependent, subunit alpha [Entomospira entomophilus]NIZ40516.1 serine dehydratase [Entomospira entomophilus]WDI36074.1 L-serine ammonia-lyase, iron-sulfur-dependent, subunit alpha [Entomospira entomophilus]
MESLRVLYKIGPGPSSSHTIGPMRAAMQFLEHYPKATTYQVELWGSLAATGKGHLTDYIIKKVFNDAKKEIHIVFKAEFVHLFHPNGMLFTAYLDEKEIGREQIFSIGGGNLAHEGEAQLTETATYHYDNFKEIYNDAKERNLELWQIAVETEGEEILTFLKDEVWGVMKRAVESGLAVEEVLPGSLQLQRRAKKFLAQSQTKEGEAKELAELFAYALAVSEENAAGSFIITAPTCGAAGLMPGLFYFLQKKFQFTDEQMAKALAFGGMFGIVIKKNASVSGAEAGCQAEIGSAASMAAAGTAYLLGATLEAQEYAAEIAMEHHLGLTCDPVDGLVQIPCIERNAVGSRRAYDAAHYAMLSEDGHRISFDTVVATMWETGLNLRPEYRETSQGGLAKAFLKGS